MAGSDSRENAPPLRWVTRDWLAAYYGIHPLTTYKWVAQGILPEPIRIAPGTVRFDLEDPRVLNAGGATKAPAAAG